MTKLLYLLLRLCLLAVHSLARRREAAAGRRYEEAAEAAEKAAKTAAVPEGLLAAARAQMLLVRAAEASESAEARFDARRATCARLERWRTNVRHFGGSTSWALLGIASEVGGLAVAYLNTPAVQRVVEMVSERWGG